MDIFKQKRYLIFVIVLLIIMNFGTLFMLWIGRPSHPPANGRLVSPEHEKVRLEQLLKVELGFDESQIEQYLKMRQEHRRQAQQLNDEIRQLKKAMFDEVLQDNSQQELSDSLLTLAQEKQAKLEQHTFQHFLDLKKLCKPEQQEHLKFLIHELFRQNSPPGMKNDGPPPLPYRN
jgi:periplasmic protein CpxP/Spy